MMMAKMQEEIGKHLCQEDDIDNIDYFRNSLHEFLDQQSMIVDFTSEAWLSEEAGLSFEQNTPSHLRGLKDFEIEFLLQRNMHHRCKK